MKITIKANINDKYFSAEYGGGISPPSIALTANRPEAYELEIFEEESLPNKKFALKTLSGYYLTVDIDGTLRTNEKFLGPWEELQWDGQYIKTHHGTYLTARIDKDLVPIETTHNKDIWEQFTRISIEPAYKRLGLVRAVGRAAQDDSGLFHPLGLTFFWALYGWKFERERILEHLEWMKQYQFDYLRILGEVNWSGRSIEPFGWPNYQHILAEFVDFAYDNYGLRTQLTMVGGKYQKDHETLVAPVVQSRPNKFMHLETANEYGRLDKISKDDLIRVSRYLSDYTPNLVALSTIDANQTFASMIEDTKEAGADMFTLHTRRSDHDAYWSAVRQGYDFKNFPYISSNNEPQGPQSSVEELSNPMQLTMARATSIVCNGAFYVLHVAQGVTGKAEPKYNRPENMWDVPNIDAIMRHVRYLDTCLPEGIENWKCVNNGRSDHPLPLDDRLGYGFWEGNSKGAVNKNYACVNGHRFVEVLLGVNNPNEQGATMVGKPIRDSHIEAHDIDNYDIVEINAKFGENVHLDGRKDKMKGYILLGNL